jgi:hypothetical protein
VIVINGINNLLLVCVFLLCQRTMLFATLFHACHSILPIAYFNSKKCKVKPPGEGIPKIMPYTWDFAYGNKLSPTRDFGMSPTHGV